MEKIIIATPLGYGRCSSPYVFSDGVEIRELTPILWESSVAGKLLSEHEREYLDASQYWLSISQLVEKRHLYQTDDDLLARARQAMYALQIICPCGGRNVYLKLRETAGGLDNVGSWHPAQMRGTRMGRLAAMEDQGLQEDFDKVFYGVRRAFDEDVVRLQNAIVLLEHGLQMGHMYLSPLMWVMGLDMLFMAGEKEPFVERLVGFLGRATQVFPAVYQDLQPQLQISEIVDDVYELRNIVAHGREIPEKPFREMRNILDTTGASITSDYTYAQIVMESALFLLSKSLRKVMVDGLVELVRDEAQWKQTLKTGARLEQGRVGPATTI